MANPQQNENSPNSDLALYLILAHSPLHVGVGEGIGHVNLPTAREHTTEYPYLPGSSIKGVLRDAFEQRFPADTKDTAKLRYGNDPVVQLFGPPPARAGDARGGMVFSDARLLFLPVRSLLGGFALVTCPLILQRLTRELKLCGRLNGEWAGALPEAGAMSSAGEAVEASVSEHSSLTLKGDSGTTLLLEDLTFGAKESPALTALAKALEATGLWDKDEHEANARRLVVVSDSDFSFFVSTCLELRHRVKIDDETGTAAASGPWLEEYIPAESVFFGLVQGRDTVLFEMPETATGEEAVTKENGATRQPAKGRDTLKIFRNKLTPNGASSTLLRFGGKSSVGAGRALFRLL